MLSNMTFATPAEGATAALTLRTNGADSVADAATAVRRIVRRVTNVLPLIAHLTIVFRNPHSPDFGGC
jgi:hypothetical protein